VGVRSGGRNFGARPNQSLIGRRSRQYLAASVVARTRQESRRGEWGGKKPWRQKGTAGRRVAASQFAVGGMDRLPTDRQPRDYSLRAPKGDAARAWRRPLAAKFQDHKLTVVDQFNLNEGKTKAFRAR